MLLSAAGACMMCPFQSRKIARASYQREEWIRPGDHQIEVLITRYKTYSFLLTGMMSQLSFRRAKRIGWMLGEWATESENQVLNGSPLTSLSLKNGWAGHRNPVSNDDQLCLSLINCFYPLVTFWHQISDPIAHRNTLLTSFLDAARVSLFTFLFFIQSRAQKTVRRCS